MQTTVNLYIIVRLTVITIKFRSESRNDWSELGGLKLFTLLNSDGNTRILQFKLIYFSIHDILDFELIYNIIRYTSSHSYITIQATFPNNKEPGQLRRVV